MAQLVAKCGPLLTASRRPTAPSHPAADSADRPAPPEKEKEPRSANESTVCLQHSPLLPSPFNSSSSRSSRLSSRLSSHRLGAGRGPAVARLAQPGPPARRGGDRRRGAVDPGAVGPRDQPAERPDPAALPAAADPRLGEGHPAAAKASPPDEFNGLVHRSSVGSSAPRAVH